MVILSYGLARIANPRHRGFEQEKPSEEIAMEWGMRAIYEAGKVLKLKNDGRGDYQEID